MEECILAHTPYPQELRDKYYEMVIGKTKELINHNTHVVLTQALIKKINRDQFRKNFPSAEFLWIVTNDEIANKRIELRQKELALNSSGTFASHMHVGVQFATRIRQQFDIPTVENIIQIVNNGNTSNLLVQLKSALSLV